MEILQVLALVGFLLLMSALSAFAKRRQERLEEEERQRQGTTRHEDLPERTRRMLVGDDVPVARPRAPQRPDLEPDEGEAASGPMVMPQTRPRQPTITMQDMVETIFGERATRPQMAPPPLAQPMRQPRPVHEIPREEGTWEEEPPPVPTARPRDVELELRRQREQEQQRRREDEARRRQEAARAQQQAQRQRVEGATRAAGRAPAHRRPAGKRALFAGPVDVRRAIILSEILNPPKSLRGPSPSPMDLP
jgi:hypothetical protein